MTYLEGYTSLTKEDIERSDREREKQNMLRNEKIAGEYKALEGHTIIKVRVQHPGSDQTFVLELDNGMLLTAEDGEYGGNALELYPKGEIDNDRLES